MKFDPRVKAGMPISALSTDFLNSVGKSLSNVSCGDGVSLDFNGNGTNIKLGDDKYAFRPIHTISIAHTDNSICFDIETVQALCTKPVHYRTISVKTNTGNEDGEDGEGDEGGGNGTYGATPIVDGNSNLIGIRFGTEEQLSKGGGDVYSVGASKYGVKVEFNGDTPVAMTFGTEAELDNNSSTKIVRFINEEINEKPWMPNVNDFC